MPLSKRDRVIALHQAHQTVAQIVRALRRYNVQRRLVTDTIARFKETGTTRDRLRSGRPRTVRTPKRVRDVAQELESEPLTSPRRIAQKCGGSRSTVRRILTDDLKVVPRKLRKTQYLTPANEAQRLEKCKRLLVLLKGPPNRQLFFSDEKTFSVERHLNPQNDRIYVRKGSRVQRDSACITRRQHPDSVMVWAGFVGGVKAPLVFFQKGEQVTAMAYRRRVLMPVLRTWVSKQSNIGPFIFVQDSAPTHQPKLTKKFFVKYGIPYITPEQWPARSPDLNPVDVFVWPYLLKEACSMQHPDVPSLKRALRRAWLNMPKLPLLGSRDMLLNRLDQCVQAAGRSFE